MGTERLRFDIAVIGAGCVGALTALELTRRGCRVAVLEAESDAGYGASGANSGIVHAGFDAMPGTLKANLNVRGAAMMPALAAALGVPYRQIGSLVCAAGDGELETLLALLARGRENGVEQLSLLDRDGFAALEPGLSPDFTAALYAPTAGVISSYRLALSALGAAMDLGAQFFPETRVTEISREAGGFLLNGRIFAPLVVDAAGLGADAVASLVGVKTVVQHARRGEYLLLDRECGALLSHTVFRVPTALGKGILVSPTADGNLLLGPTADELPPCDARTTEAGLASIAEMARKMLPGIPLGRVITSFAGVRAVGDSGDFDIRESGGFLSLAGIESPGLTASPAIAQEVADRLLGVNTDRSPLLPLNPRKPYDWFRRLPTGERNAVIARDPAFGRIVCRCEGISEGEIRDAVRRHPAASTLDAVKRRVSAGMGRCQGSFCTPSVIRILAEETGVSPEKVTKRGKGSELCVGKREESEDKRHA